MATLGGTAAEVDLGGLRISAPGVHGEVIAVERVVEAAGAGLGALVADARLARAIEASALSPIQPALRVVTRSVGEGSTTVRASVPPDTAAVLMVADHDPRGLVTWHLPRAAGPTLRGGGPVTFSVDNRRLAAAAPAIRAGATPVTLTVLARSAIGGAVDEAGGLIAAGWENRARPYRLRRLASIGASGPVWRALEEADWRDARAGRVLLLVHGLFDTVTGAFRALDRPTWATLRDRYPVILGFDHPTLHVTPEDNVRRLLRMLPEGVVFETDVLCHSRGGLVARVLSGEESGGTAGPDTRAVDVRRIVFVGTPNAGTPLAGDPEQLVNRLSNLLRLLPPGEPETIRTMLGAVLATVGFLAAHLEDGMPGLLCMRPDRMGRLNAGPVVPGERYAIGADFDPSLAPARLVRSLAVLLLDGVDDDVVFGGAANDVVVPERGVWDAPDPGFPIRERLVLGPGLTWHGTYFADPRVRARILRWLTG